MSTLRLNSDSIPGLQALIELAPHAAPGGHLGLSSKVENLVLQEVNGQLKLTGKIFPDSSNEHIFLELQEDISAKSQILGVCTQKYIEKAQSVKESLIAAFKIETPITEEPV